MGDFWRDHFVGVIRCSGIFYSVNYRCHQNYAWAPLYLVHMGHGLLFCGVLGPRSIARTLAFSKHTLATWCDMLSMISRCVTFLMSGVKLPHCRHIRWLLLRLASSPVWIKAVGSEMRS